MSHSQSKVQEKPTTSQIPSDNQLDIQSDHLNSQMTVQEDQIKIQKSESPETRTGKLDKSEVQLESGVDQGQTEDITAKINQ